MAKKIHGRRRRYQPVSSGRNRKPRPKSFPTEVQAHAWAKLNKVEKYVLKNLRNIESKTKKFIILKN